MASAGVAVFDLPKISLPPAPNLLSVISEVETASTLQSAVQTNQHGVCPSDLNCNDVITAFHSESPSSASSAPQTFPEDLVIPLLSPANQVNPPHPSPQGATSGEDDIASESTVTSPSSEMQTSVLLNPIVNEEATFSPQISQVDEDSSMNGAGTEQVSTQPSAPPHSTSLSHFEQVSTQPSAPPHSTSLSHFEQVSTQPFAPPHASTLSHFEQEPSAPPHSTSLSLSEQVSTQPSAPPHSTSLSHSEQVSTQPSAPPHSTSLYHSAVKSDPDFLQRAVDESEDCFQTSAGAESAIFATGLPSPVETALLSESVVESESVVNRSPSIPRIIDSSHVDCTMAPSSDHVTDEDHVTAGDHVTVEDHVTAGDHVTVEDHVTAGHLSIGRVVTSQVKTLDGDHPLTDDSSVVDDESDSEPIPDLISCEDIVDAKFDSHSYQPRYSIPWTEPSHQAASGDSHSTTEHSKSITWPTCSDSNHSDASLGLGGTSSPPPSSFVNSLDTAAYPVDVTYPPAAAPCSSAVTYPPAATYPPPAAPCSSAMTYPTITSCLSTVTYPPASSDSSFLFSSSREAGTRSESVSDSTTAPDNLWCDYSSDNKSTVDPPSTIVPSRAPSSPQAGQELANRRQSLFDVPATFRLPSEATLYSEGSVEDYTASSSSSSSNTSRTVPYLNSLSPLTTTVEAMSGHCDGSMAAATDRSPVWDGLSARVQPFETSELSSSSSGHSPSAPLFLPDMDYMNPPSSFSVERRCKRSFGRAKKRSTFVHVHAPSSRHPLQHCLKATVSACSK